MSHLDITVWPVDHSDTRMISKSISQMRWKSSGKQKEIAQFTFNTGALNSKPEERALIVKELKRYDTPESTNFEKLSKSTSKSGLYVADSQFSLHKISDLNTDGFEAFQDFTSLYGGMFLTEYPSVGVDLSDFQYKLKDITFQLNDRSRKLGTLQIYSEDLALLFLRDLKAMTRHIIALSNEEDEVAPWKEAGYKIPKGQSGLDLSRSILHSRLKVGLKHLHMFPVFTERHDMEDAIFDSHGFVNPSIYSIVSFQLYTYHQQNRPISRCAHKSCGMYFSTTQGYGSSRSNRSNTKFCSQRCARNNSQQVYRNRLKEEAKK